MFSAWWWYKSIEIYCKINNIASLIKLHIFQTKKSLTHDLKKHHQLEQNASTITQYCLDNSIIIIFFLTIQPSFTGCFLRIAHKAPVRIQQNSYKILYLNGYDEATYKISFFPDECFVRKRRLKFQVSKYLRGRWQSQLAARASHKYNRNNYYISPYLDARRPFLYGGSSTTTGEVKIIFIYPPFFF